MIEIVTEELYDMEQMSENAAGRESANVKVITTTGFYGTGSSAITDLFSEFDNVCCKGDYEFRIFCDPDGLSDLEYNLIENPNRHNTSNAIKRYLKQARFMNGNRIIKRYNKYFGSMFMDAVKEYVNDICEFQYEGIWYFDIFERGKTFWFFSKCFTKLYVAAHRLFHPKFERQKSLLSDHEPAYAGTYNETKFLEATRKHTDKLIRCFNVTDSEYVMLDQLVPPTNLGRYSRYYSDIRIFVVERDPRDIYLLEKLYWKGKTVPVYDVEVFCKWYKWTRGQFELFSLPENVYKVQFEDMIYKYDETIDDILNWIGIPKQRHVEAKKYFNPEVSINNTRLWHKHLEYKKDIQYIECELAKYCYHEGVMIT